MSEHTKLFERAAARYEVPDHMSKESLFRLRDRKRRNQRIAAGVVGIALFVAAIWVVTSGGWLDRSQTSVGPAGNVTGPVQTGPTQTAPPPALALGAPDVVRQRTCTDGARSRLELTNLGQFFVPTGIRMRFEVHRSPIGHSWLITLRAQEISLFIGPSRRVFRGIRVASESGDLAVERDRDGQWGLVSAKAFDTQTGQVCRVNAEIE